MYLFMSKQWKSNNLTTDVIHASGQLQHLQDTASVDNLDNDFMSINIRNRKKDFALCFIIDVEN